ncbi:hypothetical protein [Muriicola sp.]|uniref:hypothetical protein n=1 Tax=Muriicola sp. TaxID=2020856 RepID=UPI0035666001
MPPRVYILLVICLLWNPITAQEVHHITLRIDTKNFTPEKALSWAVGDNSRVLNTGKGGAFTVLASVGDHIHWEAVSLSDRDVPVKIRHVRYVKGPRIFSRNLIPGGEEMQATVIRGGEQDYMYDLVFRIGHSDQDHVTRSCIRIIN